MHRYEPDYLYMTAHGLHHPPGPPLGVHPQAPPLGVHPHSYLPSGGGVSQNFGGHSHLEGHYPMGMHGMPHGLHDYMQQPTGTAAVPGGLSGPPARLGRADPRIQMHLDNSPLWDRFSSIGTEMIIAKSGRRMFPAIKVKVTNLEPDAKYSVLMDVTPADESRYKYNGKEWVTAGKSEPFISGKLYVHPDSPQTGSHWMSHPISFQKVKLTNNTLDRQGHIILNSMHKYLPRIHLVNVSDPAAIYHLSCYNTFSFPNTSFMGVTAYQNEDITRLKIHYNPFAKGFRETGQNRSKKKGDKASNLAIDDDNDAVTSSSGDSAMGLHLHEETTLDMEMSDQGYRSSSMSPEDNSLLRPRHPSMSDEEIDVGQPPTPPPSEYLLPPPIKDWEQQKDVAETQVCSEDAMDQSITTLKEEETKEETKPKRKSKTPTPLKIDSIVGGGAGMPMPLQPGNLHQLPQDSPLAAAAAAASHFQVPSPSVMSNAMQFPFIYYAHMLNAATYGYHHHQPYLQGPGPLPQDPRSPPPMHPYRFAYPLHPPKSRHY